MRIGIIAALPGELKPLVRGWQKMAVARGSGLRMWIQQRGEDELIAVCAGMGAAAARRAFTATEHAGSLDMVLSVGWAGALTEDAEPGQCYAVSQVIDAQTGERFTLLADEEPKCRVVTTVMVAQKAEKHRLAATYGARLVDMEGAIVARLAQMRGIPFHCFKAVSDGLNTKLPDLNRFIDVSGKMELGKFLIYVSVRPQYWSSLAQLGHMSAAGAVSLARKVEYFLYEQTEVRRID